MVCLQGLLSVQYRNNRYFDQHTLATHANAQSKTFVDPMLNWCMCADNKTNVLYSIQYSVTCSINIKQNFKCLQWVFVLLQHNQVFGKQ